MQTKIHHLKYALDKSSNRIVEIDSVANGMLCGCICPLCKQHLVAKNGGSIREHHFAHYSEVECTGARMTTLHLLAQQIIQDEKVIMLPNYDGRFFHKQTKQINFDRVSLEESDGELRPDCTGIKIGTDYKEHTLWIEILVTHEVDEAKQEKIRSRGLPCIEIDLSDMLDSDYSRDSIYCRLLNEKKDRRWINCPKYDYINQQKKLEYEIQEANRIRQEKEIQKKLETEQLNRKQIRAEKEIRLKDIAINWFQSGDEHLAEMFIKEINDEPYYNDNSLISYDDEEYHYTRKRNPLFDILVPQGNFLSLTERSVKNEVSLRLFYTILHYYYDQIDSINYNSLKQQIKRFQYSRAALTAEEKIKLEQLISLRIIYILEKGRAREVYLNRQYKKIIKSYILDSSVRKGVLMVSSVFYHHIIGSNSQTFGELTREIIQEYPYLTAIYLKAINSQDIFKNNYYLDNNNMLDYLNEFVAGNIILPNEAIDSILRTCYSFAFKSDLIIYKSEYSASKDPIPNQSNQPNPYKLPVDDLKYKQEWDSLNDWYKNYNKGDT